MKKIAFQVMQQVHFALLRDGRLISPPPPAPRDGFAAMAVWGEHDFPVERLRLADIALIPPTLRLDTAPVACPGVGYELIDRRDWLVLARIEARDEIEAVAGQSYAFPDPMLVYCGWRGERRQILTGCINLTHTPTVAGLRLAAGRNYADMGAAQLAQADADDDLLMVAQCLARFYRVK